MNYDSIPQELRILNQWVLWRFSKNEKGEITKKPYQVTGNLAKSNDKTTWNTIANVLLKVKNFDGIGFVFSENDDFVGIDLDKCVNNGVIEKWALEIIKTFEDCYVEFSQSGKGIHIIFKGKIPDISDKRRGQIEIYDQGRYFCMTGNVYNGMDKVTEFKALPEWLKSIGFIKDNGNKPKQQTIPPSLTNDQIIELARNAKNGSKFLALFNGNISEYSSGSEADLAFVSLLSFYTQDKGQIINIVQQTPLWDEKWERKDYQNRTIDKCLSSVTEVYKGQGAPITVKKQTPVEKEIVETKTHIDIRVFNVTDYGNAERLVHYHGNNIRYCEQLGSWLIWDSKRWKIDENLEIFRLSKDVSRRIYAEASFCDNEEQRKAIGSHAGKSESASRLKNMVELAKSEIEVLVNPKDLDRDGLLINCENGTIDLRTGELLPHSKTDNITKIIPVSYDKMAECPRWELFLKEIFKDDKDLITFIKYAVGYSLTGSIKEECIFICYGTGRNGKSKFIDTLEFLFGDYGRNVDPYTFEERKKDGNSASEDIARLKDIRFISTTETTEGGRLSEGLIKKMTGDRIITARELYQKSIQFEQKYKIWLATNHKPIIRGTDNAIWERIKLIPFEVYFTPEQRDPDLLSKLIAEAPGILNWAVEGCLMWLNNSLSQVNSHKVADATNEYRTDMNVLGEFIAEICKIQWDLTITKQMLYNQYSEWCKEGGIYPMSKILFGRKLKESYNIAEKQGSDHVSLWVGIGLSYGFS